MFRLLVSDSPCTRPLTLTDRYVQTLGVRFALYALRWLSRTQYWYVLSTSASLFTRFSDFHVPICSVFCLLRIIRVLLVFMYWYVGRLVHASLCTRPIGFRLTSWRYVWE